MNGGEICVTNLNLRMRHQDAARPYRQREALAKIINADPASLVTLATRLAEAGLSVDDAATVLAATAPEAKTQGRDGQLMVAAIKLLANPTVLDGLAVRPYVRNHLRTLADKFARTSKPRRDKRSTSKAPSVGCVARSMHFAPLRYPGGKGKLAPFVKQLLETNDLLDGDYVEPYAGGAAIAIELLLQSYVARIFINDINRAVYAFWNTVLNDTERIVKQIRDMRLTLANWDRQKKIYSNPEQHDDTELGVATFFLNRTNRSGIFNAGVIGGRSQTGQWKIGARYNAKDLENRIRAIAAFRDRIHLSRQDALAFLGDVVPLLSPRSLIYLDPPYYVKGKDLYFDYYEHADHAAIAKLIKNLGVRQKWIVSYDNVEPIRELYATCRGIAYKLGYSAREARSGSEVMFFADSLFVPKLSGGMRPLRGGVRPYRSIGFQPLLRRSMHLLAHGRAQRE